MIACYNRNSILIDIRLFNLTTRFSNDLDIPFYQANVQLEYTSLSNIYRSCQTAILGDSSAYKILMGNMTHVVAVVDHLGMRIVVGTDTAVSELVRAVEGVVQRLPQQCPDLSVD